MDYMIENMISEKKIKQKVIELATKINKDYEKTENLILIGILRGSVILLADLVRNITFDAKIDFMEVSSYSDSMTSSLNIRILKDLEEDIEDKNILIVEDIIDTGLTLEKICDVLSSRKPKSIKICTLLDKPNRRKIKINVDYVGFSIPDEFVVGYGMDFAQKHRNLPFIGKVIKKINFALF